MTPVEVYARQAALEEFESGFNAFAKMYNAGGAAIKPFLAEYQPLMVALKTMKDIVNAASPAITQAVKDIKATGAATPGYVETMTLSLSAKTASVDTAVLTLKTDADCFIAIGGHDTHLVAGEIHDFTLPVERV